jgi:hypothetical protein
VRTSFEATAHLCFSRNEPRVRVSQVQPKESNVYVVPLIVLALIIVIATAWSPIFAFVIAVPAFVLFLAYVGLSRRADQKAPPASGAPVSGEGEGAPAGGTGGIWGEKDN